MNIYMLFMTEVVTFMRCLRTLDYTFNVGSRHNSRVHAVSAHETVLEDHERKEFGVYHSAYEKLINYYTQRGEAGHCGH